MDQVNELLVLIAAHKEMGVTGASVMMPFFKRQIQAIQQCHTLGFEYMGVEDPSRMCAEELTDDAALILVKRVLLDVNTMPYVLELFSAQNPLEPVRFRLLGKISIILKLPLTENPLQGHTTLYRSYPPQADIPRPYHLLPSATAEQKRLNHLMICPAVRQLKARSPRWRRQLKGRRTRTTPLDYPWSWWKPCHQSPGVVRSCASVKQT
jgi:hypothetical protein